MGSLKDEMRGLREDHQPCEKADDGVCSGGSDGSSAPAGQQPHTGQGRETQGDYLQKVHVDENLTSKDQALSGGDCGTVDPSDSKRERILTDVVPEGVKTITASLNNDATIGNELVRDGGEVADARGAEKTAQDKGKSTESEKILVPVPSTPDPCDPRSPAPSGQQHMRTQVSLEVVQCCSVATSPMTPPEGGHSFFFPSSFGKSGAVGTETKDAEQQVSRQVEFCSVATSPFPMTPKTPSATAFPELTGRETAPREEKVGRDEEQRETVQKESAPPTRSQGEAESEITGALKATASKEPTEGFTSPDTINCAASGSVDSQGTLGDSNQQSKQQRMGSMDQDITILVTHYVNNEEEEEEEEKEETPLCSTEPDVGKIEEVEEEGCAAPDEMSNTDQPQNKTEEPSTNQQVSQSGESQVKETKDAREETKPRIPESPAPFGCHNIRTQVSLEVVQCQSAATSPMTPPEGDQAFYFPSSLGKCTSVGTEMKDAEMQVGQQVEFRSVATAPMTPRTPTVTTFPEVRKDMSVEEKIVEEEEDTKEQVEEDEGGVAEKKRVTEENKANPAEQEKGMEGGEGKSEDKGEEKGVKEDEECKEEGEVTGEGDKEEKGGEKNEERCKEEKVTGEGDKEENGGEKRGEGRSTEEEVTDEEEKEEKGEEKCKEEGEERCERDGEAMDEEDEDEKDEEKSEEPVQEVSWDEKGMTWEVYGAVVEVAVLGSAIQKHLEKQVKKQKLQAALPPPPPLNPSATPLTAETAQRGSGSGKGRAGKRGEQDGKVGRRRRNPFRQLMENMQQPHCCSRAHTTE